MSDLRPRIKICSPERDSAWGEWVEAAQPPSTLLRKTGGMLAGRGGAGRHQWTLLDHEGFHAFQPNEFDDLETLAAVARGIERFGPPFSAWAEFHDAHPDCFDSYESAFRGRFQNLADYAEAYVSERNYLVMLDELSPPAVREHLHFDLAGLGESLERRGDIYVCPTDLGGVWVYTVGH